MKSIKPIYIVALVSVILLVVFIKINNPYRDYSTKKYWENSTLESVNRVPEEALKSGNKNGPVLMWAAMSTSDTEVIKELVSRGAEINEADEFFSGTPLTGAAGYSKYPEILRELVALGADINKKVNNDETALMIAAQYNKNKGIIEELVALGANISNKNKQGKTALDLAIYNNNTVAEQSLKALMHQS
ncbi:MAG: hypothetical protein GQ583_05995 [Methyloprofundus sp.]|nr:hypothetical protein [Methyloprofundus sp.]